MYIEDVARITHEANRALCEVNKDWTQNHWNSAPEWQRKSAINGVIFHMENPDASPSASHENWMKEKLADGWVFGEVKDEVKKTHPCLVEYEALPEFQQAKDHLFRSIVHALAPFISGDTA